MIGFLYKGDAVSLSPGQLWSSKASSETYKDTPSERLWSLVERIHAGIPWRQVVSEAFADSQPWLHRIIQDPSRDLYLRQYPLPAGGLVLDVGAGWGQYSLPLAKARRVVCVEPTLERLAFIRAAAEQEGVLENMYFVHADFLDLEFGCRFDHAFCIGVLEWVPRFRPGKPLELQKAFLRRLRGVLSDGGGLVLGIENRLGLKYLLGCPDDHTGQSLVSVYDGELASGLHREKTGQELRAFTFSQAELQALLAGAGFSSQHFLAAYPDYKLPERILPMDDDLEERLLRESPVLEHDGYAGCPLAIQPLLNSHYRSLAQMKISRFFAPSFFVKALA